jgi:hypothetical protein
MCMMVLDQLQSKIEELRNKMIESGVSNGLNSDITLNLSKELDFLLNSYFALINSSK